MTIDQGLDWCRGCASKPQVNLPEGWQPGDALPDGLTLHTTARERANGKQPFAFIGPKHRQQRHYMDQAK